MNTCPSIVAALVIAAFAAPTAAQEPPQSLPTVRAEAVLHVVDCGNRSLPSQREVAEWTGQHNFSQVYDTRKRLMAEVGRNCRKSGVEQVQLVSSRTPAPRDLHFVAVANRRDH